MKKNALNRRDFIKSTITGAAGFAFLGPAASNLTRPEPGTEPEKQKMIYRTLGKTGIKLPIVSMGVMNSHNPNLVQAALDAGIVHLDTAHGYQQGRNEEMIGGVLKGRPRNSFVIGTKVPRGRFDSPQEAARVFRERSELSIQRLGLKYVDIFYLHNIKKAEDAVDRLFLDLLSEFKAAGKTRFLGISTHQNEPEVIQAAIESKVYDLVLTAHNFKQDHYKEVRAAIAKAAAAGLGVVAMKPFAGGYLDKEKTIPVNAKAALKWVLQDPNVHTAIPGFTTFDQLHADLAVMEDLALTEPEQKDLQVQGSLPGLYCQACQHCLPQCPQRLPIPDIMRAFMYTYGYKNLAAAQDLLSSLSLPADVCQDCHECSVHCAKGFDVADRVRDVVRLREVPSRFVA